jgi:hypothetical protein
MSFFSGYEYYKMCKLSFCPRYPKISEEIKENDLVFVNLDNFEELLNNIPKNKFRLITHNSDSSFTKDHLDSIKDYISKIYAINCIIKNPIIKKIPIGFSDNIYDSHETFIKINQENNIKSIFVYMNFSINTNEKERTNCFNKFSKYSWVTKEQNIPREEFYRQLSKSKYTISPEGTGIDCHRIYESIFFDCIPIIKSCALNDLYKGMPVLIVKNWEDADEVFLNKNYNNLYDKLKDWKIKNYNWYKSEFWLN